MGAADRHRNLLFGLLAFRSGLIDEDQLESVYRAWNRDDARPIAELLVERGHLNPDERAGVESIVELHLKKNGGDTGQSVESLQTVCAPGAVVARARSDAIETGPLEPSASPTVSFVSGNQVPGDSVGSATSDGQRFRVLRPHARGGLGAVFVALDCELHREVALKQILDHHADDPASRQRFELEAEITGNLEHPGIVPVYGLGTYGDGRPYYAMRFIRGNSLAAAIDRFHADATLKQEPGRRSLELRNLLGRFTDVCHAIEYAHSRGVLHRDIKPGNIIVGNHGETLVVDWGLAKPMTGRAPGAGSGEPALIPTLAAGAAETQAGSTLGTPAYMSPEQAAGNLEQLGPPSDVYSLGATLYCLLTGKPPFAGEVTEVMQAVRSGGFPPPRRIDPTVDRALEAVCLKAMALEPSDRYASPQTLVDELERWLADEAVTAWREPRARRVRRWARRNRTAVASAAAALLAAMAGLAGILAVQAHANVRLAAKNRELTLANARANDSAATARRVVNDYLDRITASPQLQRPGLANLRRDLLTRALNHYETFLRDSVADPRLRAEGADAENRAAIIQSELGDSHKAVEAGRRAVALNEQLVREQPDRASHRSRLGHALSSLGQALRMARRTHEARDACQKAVTIQEALCRAEPENAERRRSLGNALHNLAVSDEQLGREDEAERLYRKAVDEQRRACGAHPEGVRDRTCLTDHLLSLGEVRLRRGDLKEAARLAEETAALWTHEPGPLQRAAALLAACAGQDRSPDSRPRRDRFGQAAVALLRKTVEGGDPDLHFLRSSPALDPIRDRDDFQTLLRDLGNASPSAKPRPAT